jgi:thioredoxin reductase (NADPH)
MEGIDRQDDGFVVRTSQRSYRASSVLLAIGRRGTPRKLGVPGEEQPKVVYRLIDPEQYRGQHVLIVGGGDSALEAALTLAEQPGTVVTLSYRGEAFSRVKAKNRTRLEEAAAAARLKVMLRSNVLGIDSRKVALECVGRALELRNDAVIVNAGGELPTGLLKTIGIAFETKYGTA